MSSRLVCSVVLAVRHAPSGKKEYSYKKVLSSYRESTFFMDITN